MLKAFENRNKQSNSIKIIAVVLATTLCILNSGCCNEADIPKNIEKLNSSLTRERNQAALDLAGCGTRAKGAVPRLAELLYDESVGVQSSASYALRKIDTPEARAIMREIETQRTR